MKIFNPKNIIVTIVLLGVQIVDVLAKNADNPPPPRGNDGLDNCCVVGGAINDYLPILFFVAIIFGVIMISRMKLKASTT